MKASLFVFASSIVSAVAGCTKIVQFTSCVNTADLESAGCNSKVADTPTLEYYQCLCAAGQKALSCYAICSEDSQIQLQYRSRIATVSSTCQVCNIIFFSYLNTVELIKVIGRSKSHLSRFHHHNLRV